MIGPIAARGRSRVHAAQLRVDSQRGILGLQAAWEARAVGCGRWRKIDDGHAGSSLGGEWHVGWRRHGQFVVVGIAVVRRPTDRRGSLPVRVELRIHGNSPRRTDVAGHCRTSSGSSLLAIAFGPDTVRGSDRGVKLFPVGVVRVPPAMGVDRLENNQFRDAVSSAFFGGNRWAGRPR